MSILGVITVVALGLLGSALLLVAAWEDWEMFTNPPAWTALFYSQGLLRLIFPREVMRWITGFLGVAVVAATMIFVAGRVFGY